LQNTPLHPIVPALVMEQTFYTGLHTALSFAEQHLELSYPALVEIGLIGARDASLNFPPENNFEPIRQDEIIVQKILADGARSSIDVLLLEFFNEVFDKTGFARPTGLHGFPPDRPWDPRR
jgi:hypothetical protein